MATLSHSSSSVYAGTHKTGLLALINNFVAKAEFNRIGWAATALAIQGCVFSPAVLLTMSFYGGGDWQFLVSMLGFLAVLVPVLSALPVKFIFRTFAFSAVIHLVMILLNIL